MSGEAGGVLTPPAFFFTCSVPVCLIYGYGIHYTEYSLERFLPRSPIIFVMTYVLQTLRATLLMLMLVAAFAFTAFTAFAQSADPVSPEADLASVDEPVPEVLGASADASIDPVAASGSVDGVVLGASVEPSVDPVSDEGAVLGEATDEVLTDAVGESMDPVTTEVVAESTGSAQLSATAALNVRVSPSADTESLGLAFPGMTATVIDGPVEFDGLKWLKVVFETGLSGWSAANWLQ